MIRAYIDGNIMYDSNRAAFEQPYRLLDGRIMKRASKSGSFTFTISNKNRTYTYPKQLMSIVTVEQDGKKLFRGRILDITLDVFRNKKIVCEGDLAFLNDSIISPFTYSGDVIGLLTYLINIHNGQMSETKKHFKLGLVTVAKAVSVTTDTYKSTMQIIMDHLIPDAYGYLATREENGIVYIDYLDNLSGYNHQIIEVGKNVIDMIYQKKGGDIYTAVVPVSRKTDGSYLNVASVNNGSPVVKNSDLVTKYGTIIKVVEHEDVATAADLYQLGLNDAANLANISAEYISVTVADLGYSRDDVDKIDFSKVMKIYAPESDLEPSYDCEEMTINLLEPWRSVLKFGDVNDKLSRKDMIVNQPSKTNSGTNTGPTYTNLLDSVAYENGKYLSGNGTGNDANYFSTAKFPLVLSASEQHTIYIKGNPGYANESHCRIGLYSNMAAESTTLQLYSGSSIAQYFSVTQLGEGYWKLTPLTSGSYVVWSGRTVGAMRISLKGTGENTIISIDNPIE